MNTTEPFKFKCPPGTYNPKETQISLAACKVCDEGKYCLGSGNEDVSGNCSAGYYCPGSASNSTMIMCPSGSFCPEGSKSPTLCSGGYFCATPGLSNPTHECSAGFFCTNGAVKANPTDSSGGVCPKGFFCPQKSSSPSPCPLGTFLNSTQNVWVFFLLFVVLIVTYYFNLKSLFFIYDFEVCCVHIFLVFQLIVNYAYQDFTVINTTPVFLKVFVIQVIIVAVEL